MIWLDYDYAIVRAVPRVDLGAFTNVGVVLQVRTSSFLACRLVTDLQALEEACPEVDHRLLGSYLEAYARVCAGGPDAGAMGVLPPSERFHWLTAPRSGVLQTSHVHAGRCVDPVETLDRLFNEIVSP